MKTIITAINNNEINRYLAKTEKYKIPYLDFCNQEDLLEIIYNEEIDILITLDSIDGELNRYEYLNAIKLNSSRNTKLIVVTESRDNEYEKHLKNIGFDIVLNIELLNIKNITNIINDKEIINTNKMQKEDLEHRKTIPHKVITVFGNDKSGKTLLSILLAKKIAKETNLKVVLWDLDILKNSVDIYIQNDMCINQNSDKFVFDKIVEAIDRKLFNKEFLSSIIIEDIKIRNLSYITGNTSQYNCYNKLNRNYYEKTYKILETMYDVVIIDISSNMFIDSVRYAIDLSKDIIFLMEADNISIREASGKINILLNLWEKSTGDIKVILNKYSNNSISKDNISKLIDPLKVYSSIKYNNAITRVVNSNYSINDILTEEQNSLDNILEIIGIDYKQSKKSLFKDWRKK